MGKKKGILKKAAGRFTAALAAFSLLACGCGKQAGQSAAGDANAPDVLLGRYVEAFTQADNPLGRCTAPVRLDDGGIAVFSYN